MATVTERPVQGYAHCGNAHCPGHQQQKVDAFRVETSHTYAETGGPGSVPGVENSHVHVRWANDEDRVCPGCGGTREVTATARRVLQPLSGHPQDGLLQHGAFNPNHQPTDPRIAELQAQVQALLEAQKKSTS
jgi:hypothetical protein